MLVYRFFVISFSLACIIRPLYAESRLHVSSNHRPKETLTPEGYEDLLANLRTLELQRLHLLEQIEVNAFPAVRLDPKNAIPDAAFDFIDASAHLGKMYDPISLVAANVLGRLHAAGAIHNEADIDNVVSLLRDYGRHSGYQDPNPNYQDPLADEERAKWKALAVQLVGVVSPTAPAFRSFMAGYDISQANSQKMQDQFTEQFIRSILGDDFDLQDREAVTNVNMEPAMLVASEAQGGPLGSKRSLLASKILDKTLGHLHNNGNYLDPQYKFKNSYADWRHQRKILEQNNPRLSNVLQNEFQDLNNTREKSRQHQQHISESWQRSQTKKLKEEYQAERNRLNQYGDANPELKTPIDGYQDALENLRHELQNANGSPESSSRVDNAQRMVSLKRTELEIAGIKRATDDKKRQETIGMIQAAMGVGTAVARLVGVNHPNEARAIQAVTTFGGGLAIALLIPEPTTKILALAAVFLNLIADAIGGNSVNAQMEALRLARLEIQEMRKEMHSLAGLLSDQEQRHTMLQLTAMLSELHQIEERFGAEFHNARELDLQTHDGIQKSIAATRALETKFEVMFRREHMNNIKEEFENTFNREMQPRPDLSYQEFHGTMNKLVSCATRKVYDGIPPIINGRSLEDLPAKDLHDLYIFLGQGPLNSNATSSMELLPLMNSVFTRMGLPLWDADRQGKTALIMEKSLPNISLWAYCANAYLKTMESKNKQVIEWVRRFSEHKDAGNAGSTLREVLRPGELANHAVSKLAQDERYFRLVFDQLRNQVRALENETNQSYNTAMNGGSVHGGPFQSPWTVPKLMLSNELQPHIFFCDEIAAEAEAKGLTKQLRHAIPIIDREDFIRSLPPWAVNAEGTGLKAVQACISKVEWVRNPQNNTYGLHFGNLFDWYQGRFGKLEITFEVRTGSRKYDFKWISPEVQYETRTHFQDPVALDGAFRELARKKNLKNLFEFANDPFRLGKAVYTDWIYSRLKFDQQDPFATVLEVLQTQTGPKVFDQPLVTERNGRGTTILENQTLPGKYIEENAAKISEDIKQMFKAHKWISPLDQALPQAEIDKLPPPQQDIAKQYKSFLTNEIQTFYHRMNMVNADGSFVDGDAMLLATRRTMQGLLKRNRAFLKTHLVPLIKDAETAQQGLALKKLFEPTPLKVYDGFFRPEFDKNGKTTHLPYLTEVELRKQAVRHENTVRTSLAKELKYRERLDAIEGLKRLLELAEKTATGSPVQGGNGLRILAPTNEQDGAQEPLVKSSAFGSDENRRILNQIADSALFGRDDILMLSNLGLPMSSPNSANVFKLWYENIDKAENRILSLLQQQKYRRHIPPLLESVLPRGWGLLEPSKAPVGTR